MCRTLVRLLSGIEVRLPAFHCSFVLIPRRKCPLYLDGGAKPDLELDELVGAACC